MAELWLYSLKRSTGPNTARISRVYWANTRGQRSLETSTPMGACISSSSTRAVSKGSGIQLSISVRFAICSFTILLRCDGITGYTSCFYAPAALDNYRRDVADRRNPLIAWEHPPSARPCRIPSMRERLELPLQTSASERACLRTGDVSMKADPRFASLASALAALPTAASTTRQRRAANHARGETVCQVGPIRRRYVTRTPVFKLLST